MKFFFLLFLLPFLAEAKDFVPAAFSANYEETMKSITGKTKISTGKIDYKFPSHLRFEVIKPDPVLYIVNPQKSWFYRPAFIKGEKNEVTIQKSSNHHIIKFLDSIKNGIESSKLFKTTFKGNDAILVFVDAIKNEMGLAEVHLHANKDAKTVKELKDFEKLTLKHLNKSSSTVKFLDLKEDVSFPAQHFEFVPPANTKVQNI